MKENQMSLINTVQNDVYLHELFILLTNYSRYVKQQYSSSLQTYLLANNRRY
jgi:hypothetical protein